MISLPYPHKLLWPNGSRGHPRAVAASKRKHRAWSHAATMAAKKHIEITPGMGLHITRHAIDRCIERVPGITTEDQARTLLSSRAILAAAGLGAKYVRLGTGHRVVIEEGRVTTVLPTNTHAWKMGSRWDRIRQHARGWARFYREDDAA